MGPDSIFLGSNERKKSWKKLEDENVSAGFVFQIQKWNGLYKSAAIFYPRRIREMSTLTQGSRVLNAFVKRSG